jgi:hypothetical protein
MAKRRTRYQVPKEEPKKFTAIIYKYTIKTDDYINPTHCIYVGQTTRTLDVRDREHRRKENTDFDKALKTEKYKDAKIEEICRITCSSEDELKKEACFREYECMLRLKTYRSSAQERLEANVWNTKKPNFSKEYDAMKKKEAEQVEKLSKELEELTKQLEKAKQARNMVELINSL